MTDMGDMPEPDWSDSWEAAQAGAPLPAPAPITGVPAPVVTVQPVYDLADHIFTLSVSPNKAAMLVVRAMSAADLKARQEEIAAEGLWVAIAEMQHEANTAKPAAETVMQQLGATPIGPNGYPAAPMGQPQYPVGPPVPSPGPAPFGAGPAQVAAAGWGAGAPAVPAGPPGWFRVSAPFAQRAAFDAVKQQLEAQQLRKGNMKWEPNTKTWLVSPHVVGLFQQWGPTPA